MLYFIENEPLIKFYKWNLNGSYDEVPIGDASINIPDYTIRNTTVNSIGLFKDGVLDSSASVNANDRIPQNLFFVSNLTELEDALSTNNGLPNIIRLTNDITVDVNTIINGVLSNNVILDGGIDTNRIVIDDGIDFRLNGADTNPVEIYVPIVLSGSTATLSGEVWIQSKNIFGNGTLTIDDSIKLDYEYKEATLILDDQSVETVSQTYWHNTNRNSGLPENIILVSTKQELIDALAKDVSQSSKVIYPLQNINIDTAETIVVRKFCYIQNTGAILSFGFDNTITFSPVPGASLFILPPIRLSTVTTHNTTFKSDSFMSLWVKGVYGNSILNIENSLSLFYEGIFSTITLNITSTNLSQRRLWNSSYEHIDYTSFTAGDIPIWLNNNLTASGIERVTTLTNDNEYQFNGGIRIPGNENEALSFAGTGKIYVNGLDTPIWKTNNNIGFNLTHGRVDVQRLTANSLGSLNIIGNELFIYEGTSNATWGLPELGTSVGVSDTTLNDGFYFYIKTSNNFTVTLNAFTGNTFQTTTTTSTTLTGNSWYLIYIKSGKWGVELLYSEAASGNVLANVNNNNIPIKINERLEDSGIRRLADGSLLAPRNFGVESGSILFGDIIKLSEVSGYLATRSYISGQQYSLVDSEFNTTGSIRPKIFDLRGEKDFIINNNYSNNISNNEIIIDFFTINPVQINSLELRGGNLDSTNVRITIKYINENVIGKYLPSKASWLSGTDGYTVNANEFRLIEFSDTQLRDVKGGRTFRITIKGDLNLGGNSQNVPYLVFKVQEGRELGLSYELEPFAMLASEGEANPLPNVEIGCSLDGTDGVVNMPEEARDGDIIKLLQLINIGSNKLTFKTTNGDNFVYQRQDGTQAVDTEVILNQSIQVEFIRSGDTWRFYHKF